MADLLHPAADSQEQDSEGAPADPGDYAVAGNARDALEADLIVDALEEAGISAFVDSERKGMVEKLAAPAEGYPVRVPAKDLEKARALFEERKAALEADPDAAARAAEEAEAAEEATAAPAAADPKPAS
jgi:hypothetical protein